MNSNRHIMLRFFCKNRTFFLFAVLFFSFSFAFAQSGVQLNSSEDYISRIQEEFKNERWEEAKPFIDSGVKEYPNDSDIHTLAGKYYHHIGNLDRARYHLLKALNIFHRNVEAKHILVNVETEAGRYSSAICYVNELLEVNPYWRGLWRKKIELYQLQGNRIEANRLRRRIYHIYPQDEIIRTDYFYELELEANEKYKSGNYEEAIELQKTLLRENPDDVSIYLNLSNSFLKNQNLQQALATIEQGLYRYPDNDELVRKKAGILAETGRYDLLLPFLNSYNLNTDYNYYLTEAARQSKSYQPYYYYGQIFDRNPGNVEAFDILFAHNIAHQDYEQALYILNRHRNVRGHSKDLYLKELRIYQLAPNKSASDRLIKHLKTLYPNDNDILEAYTLVIMDEAKNKMFEHNYREAIPLWYEVLYHGDEELKKTAQNSLLNSYIQIQAYTDALNVLNEMLSDDPDNPELHLKKSDLYFKQKSYHQALLAYERLLENLEPEKRQWYLSGYDDMMTSIVKEAMENYQYPEAYRYTERWLNENPNNNLALRYGINLSVLLNNRNALTYAERGMKAYPDDLFFLVKVIELKNKQGASQEEIQSLIENGLAENPYHPDLININTETIESYSLFLIQQNKSEEALERLNNALKYDVNNKSLKYAKGLAFEKLKQFDSAYYYQSFYEPHPREEKQFYRYLDYLDYRQKKNEIGIYHLRSRYGDNPAITSISTFEYTRLSEQNTYTGRVHYAGRDTGKGYQLQGEWWRYWNDKTATKIDVAWANQYFSKLAINASVYRYFESLNNIELELGLGFREWDMENSDANIENPYIYNLVVGATKEWEFIRLNFRFNNFYIDDNWFFNATLNGRYNVFTPKTYFTAMAGVGTSPDVDLINYQLYNRFEDFNTMVGAGFSHLIYKTMSAGIIGTWYNFQTSEDRYRNLYNIYLNVNVAF